MIERAELLEHVRKQKLFWVEHTERGDMPPATIAFRGGKLIGTIFAPQIDKHMGLQAAHLCRRGLAADQIVCVFDAHVYRSKPGEDYEKVRATWPDGSMQKACDINGVCATGEISDCLTVLIVDEAGNVSGETLTYDYHGRSGGVPFKWTPYYLPDNADPSQVKHGGFLANNLVAIMAQPTTEGVLTLLARSMGLNDPEKQRHHTDRAVMTVFKMQGYMCCHLVPTLRDLAEAGWSLSPRDRATLRNQVRRNKR